MTIGFFQFAMLVYQKVNLIIGFRPIRWYSSASQLCFVFFSPGMGYRILDFRSERISRCIGSFLSKKNINLGHLSPDFAYRLSIFEHHKHTWNLSSLSPLRIIASVSIGKFGVFFHGFAVCTKINSLIVHSFWLRSDFPLTQVCDSVLRVFSSNRPCV